MSLWVVILNSVKIRSQKVNFWIWLLLKISYFWLKSCILKLIKHKIHPLFCYLFPLLLLTQPSFHRFITCCVYIFIALSIFIPASDRRKKRECVLSHIIMDLYAFIQTHILMIHTTAIIINRPHIYTVSHSRELFELDCMCIECVIYIFLCWQQWWWWWRCLHSFSECVSHATNLLDYLVIKLWLKSYISSSHSFMISTFCARMHQWKNL